MVSLAFTAYSFRIFLLTDDNDIITVSHKVKMHLRIIFKVSLLFFMFFILDCVYFLCDHYLFPCESFSLCPHCFCFYSVLLYVYVLLIRFCIVLCLYMFVCVLCMCVCVCLYNCVAYFVCCIA